jgi:AGCS family alanine or glycine:cation symporter
MKEIILSAFVTFVDKGSKYVWETPQSFPWLVALLLAAGIFTTFRMGWVQFRQLGHAINVIRGRYDNPADEGDINHFQALSTALSATVGIGNIGGVAIGIHYGGPGILFWLWISGIFGMALKYAECTLSMNFRTFDEKGNASGGPMYYIERGLGSKWKWMAVLFAFLAIVCSFGSGNMNQANTVAISAADDFRMPDWITGLVLVSIVALVILGGIRRIGAVSSRLMPFMTIVYVVSALVILFMHVGRLPGVFKLIIDQAFSPQAKLGGTALGVWHFTMMWGIRRALFSNEAGQGSAPIAHAAAKTKEPVREGVVAMVGPFIDTIIICTMTGLVIVLAGVWDKKKDDKMFLEPDKITIMVDPGFKVDDSYLHNPKVEKLKVFEGTATVSDGKAQGLLFEVNHGFIDEPVILQNNEPYTGPMTIAGTKVKGGGGETLNLEIDGKMLISSSALTAWAFQESFRPIAPWGNLIVTFAVFLFALSTIISWSYYGDRCVEYLFGVKYVMLYRTIYCCFTYIGAVTALETVWAYGDLALGCMSAPNLIALFLLSPVLVRISKDYFSREQKMLR